MNAAMSSEALAPDFAHSEGVGDLALELHGLGARRRDQSGLVATLLELARGGAADERLARAALAHDHGEGLGLFGGVKDPHESFFVVLALVEELDVLVVLEGLLGEIPVGFVH